MAKGGVSLETKFHALAVDDSIVDRKLIERLLKTSSYQGKSKYPELLYWIFLIKF